MSGVALRGSHDFFHALKFYNDLLVDQYVDSEAAIELHPFVFDWYRDLQTKLDIIQ